YPSLGETLAGLSDPTFLRGSIGILFFERYSLGTIAAASVTAVLVFVLQRTRASPPSWEPLGAFASIVVVAATILLVMRTSEPPVPPLIRLVSGAAMTRRDAGVRGVLEETHFDEEAVKSGLSLYGFEPNAALKLREAASTDCRPHPLSRPLFSAQHHED